MNHSADLATAIGVAPREPRTGAERAAAWLVGDTLSCVLHASLDHGVWIRPFRDLIYVMPPYISSPAEVEQIGAAMVAAAKASTS